LWRKISENDPAYQFLQITTSVSLYLKVYFFAISVVKVVGNFENDCLTSIRKCLFINWLIIFKQTIFSRHRIQSLSLISYKYNTIQKNVKFLFTNKQNSGASETFWIKWMYQLEEISPHNYTQGPAFVWWCTLKIIGMLVHFFYFMDF
jgi:hypothetical protein